MLRSWEPPRPVTRRLRGALRMLLALTLAGLCIYGATWYVVTRYWQPRSHLRLAQEAVERRNFAAAEAHLTSCQAAWPDDPMIHFLLARAERRNGDVDEAEQQLLICRRLEEAKRTPPVGDTRLEWALLEAQRGNLTKVEGYLRSCLREDHADSLLILESLSWQLMTANRLQEARWYLERWLEQRPDEREALVRRAWVAEHMFDFAAALTDYKKVLTLEPTNDNVRLRVAEILVQQRQPAEALAQLEQVGRASADVTLCRARCQRQMGQLSEAAELLDQILPTRAQDAQALGERGMVALELNQLADAESWLRKAAAVEPHNRQINHGLYQCLQRLGKTEEAKKFSAQLAETDEELKKMDRLVREVMKKPHDPALRYEVGMIFLRNGFVSDGLHWLQTALNEDPRHRPTHEALAEYYEHAGDHERASMHRELLSQDGIK